MIYEVWDVVWFYEVLLRHCGYDCGHFLSHLLDIHQELRENHVI